MKRHHNHIALLIIAFSVTLFVYTLYGYMNYRVNVSLADALTVRSTLAKNESYKQEQKELTSLYEKTATDRASVFSFFVKDSDTVSFIETIESLGGRTGSRVVLSSIDSIDPSGQNGKFGFINAGVQVQGSWSAVIRTLMLAEVLPYKISIGNIRLNSSGSSDPKNLSREWNLSFVLKATTIHDAN